jgi:putative SOS response-associated peptidase YedK
MCQRYVLSDQTTAEREFLPCDAWWKFSRRFNVAAGQYVPAVRLYEGRSEGVMLRWGLIPSWLEGTPDGPPRTSMCRERLAISKACRGAWVGNQRCILPVAGFYVWQLTEEGHRQPFFVRLLDRSVFGIAAVWDRWVSDDDDVIESCSMISVPANELMADIGAAARGMPAILRRRHYRAWLEGEAAEAQSFLQSYNAEWMRAHPVSPRINASRPDDPGLIRIAS